MYDIVIIGAGVVGGMIARELARYELKICILEKENDVAMGATKANSAIVHAGFDAKEGSMKAKMNVRGSQMMQKVAEELGVKYIRNESLVVAFESEREEVEAIYERGVKNGVEGLRIVEHDELMALEPNLNPELSCALLAPTGAIVCPYELCISAIGNAMDNGADLKLNFEVAFYYSKLFFGRRATSDPFYFIKLFGCKSCFCNRNVILWKTEIRKFIVANSYNVAYLIPIIIGI